MTVRRLLFDPEFVTPSSWTNFGIGFDKFFDDFANIERRLTDQHNYPPHNLKRVGDDQYELELAVAGFSQEDISIELEKQLLTVRGTKNSEPDGVEYLHRGLGLRGFTKTLALADNVQVRDAVIEHGILRIRLERVVPEKDKKRLIAVNTPKQLSA